jgi:hypothetical protein
MNRTRLMAVLIAIQDEPANGGRDLMATAKMARSDEELSGYVLAHFRRLPDDETKQRILDIARIISDTSAGQ